MHPRKIFDGVTPSVANPGDSGTSKSVVNLNRGSVADVDELVVAVPVCASRPAVINEPMTIAINAA
jgi:hypothetical protein